MTSADYPSCQGFRKIGEASLQKKEIFQRHSKKTLKDHKVALNQLIAHRIFRTREWRECLHESSTRVTLCVLESLEECLEIVLGRARDTKATVCDLSASCRDANPS